MDEPRFGRMWRRRAFGLPRGAKTRAFDRKLLQRNGLELLADTIGSLAAKLGVKLKGRRARLRLVHPEQERAPKPVDPAVQSVRMDARGLQRMLENEYVIRSSGHVPPEDPEHREPVRRSG